MSAMYPGGSNTFVPSHEASGKLVVDFSRNPKAFPIAKYAQIVKPKNTVGYYMKMTVEQAGRLLESDGKDLLWADGTEAPQGRDGTESFEFLKFFCRRYASAYNIGYLTSEQATWDILAQHGRIHASRMMTLRTQLAISQLTTTSNYAASHYSAVSSISGVSSKWDVSTTAFMSIKTSLDYAAEVIGKDTLSVVKPDDLILVMSPGCARKISRSQELVDHLKGSPDILAYLKGESGPSAQYGLMPKLFGYNVVIEDSVKVTSKKGGTDARSYVLGDTTPFLCARPGGLTGVEGAPSFSTMTLFMYEEMTVESKDDPDNRLTRGRVVENYDAVLTAPVSGFLFTAAVD